MEPSSQRLYGENLRRIKNHMNSMEEIKDFLKDKKLSTQLSYLSSILYDKKRKNQVEKEIREYYEKLKKKHNEEYIYRRPTEVEEKNHISYQQIIDMREKYRKMKDKNEKIYFHFLILSLYTYLPPIRGSEYINAQYIFQDVDYETKLEEDGMNLIDMKNKKIVIGHYKTKKQYGIRIIDIPEELYDVLQEYFHYKPCKYMFRKKISNSSFTKRLNEIFHKNVSTSMLRKLYISEYVKDMTIEQRKKLSKIMGHSIATQELVYRRFGQKHD